MINEVEPEYEKLRKKYPNLPNFRNLDKEFEVVLRLEDKIIPRVHLLRTVSNLVSNHFLFFVDYLHNLIFPNPSSIIIMEESKIYSEEEKDKIENLIKKLTFFTRKNLELSVIRSEKEDVKFIVESYKEWKSMKKPLLTIIEKATKHWKS